MNGSEWFVVGGIVVLAVLMIMYYTKSSKRIRKLLFGSLSGVALLYPAQLVLSSMGYAISMNLFTVSTSVVLGIPGVLLLAVAQFL